ncbi:MAG TPA: hypothetical protein VF421_20135 [Niabella sp.]|jgi:hypothetical protein
MKASYLLILFPFLTSFADKERTLDIKYPLVVDVWKSASSSTIQNYLSLKLAEKRFKIISFRKAKDLLVEKFAEFVREDNHRLNDKTDVVAHTKMLMGLMPVVYQILSVKIVEDGNGHIDSCFYAVTYTPPGTKIEYRLIPDSITKSNNPELLASIISELACSKETAKRNSDK